MFGKLLGRNKKGSSSAAPAALPSGIQSAIYSVVGARSIPTMPAAAQKAFQLSTDPNAEARDFVEVIESDEALSARVLKIANSVFFDRGNKTETIEEAVLVIGINELRCLLNATTLKEIFPSNHPSRIQFWTNDIATAIISKLLAQRVMPQKQELAFLAGLMHDIGKLLLVQRAGNDYSQVIKVVEDKGCEFSQAETEIFVFDHTEVGLLIAERWNFGDELKAVIRKHHNSWAELQEGSSTEALVMLVKAADLAAHALGLGHPRGMNRRQRQAEEELDQAWAALQIPPDERRRMLQSCERAFNSERDLYSSAVNPE
ncbi:MAG: HDOD domain-containing protein [Oligoflexia bacterium]|nr:HDOD domain-containing protein [Oligoflexia bacterium]